jgi:hypothetical protein
MSQPSKGHRPVTRAKNASQHPGQVVLDSQQKRRGHEEMSKVRAQERLDLRIAKQRLQTALKRVAKVQDRQQTEDVEDEQLVVAPSLRRHETMLRMSASAAEENTDSDSEKEKTDTNDDKSDPGPLDEDQSSADEWVEEKSPIPSPEPEGSDAEMADIEDERRIVGQRRKGGKGKKETGSELRTLIDTLRKNPRPASENPKVDLALVTKAPPIPAKGKRARAMYVVTSVLLPRA